MQIMCTILFIYLRTSTKNVYIFGQMINQLHFNTLRDLKRHHQRMCKELRRTEYERMQRNHQGLYEYYDK